MPIIDSHHHLWDTDHNSYPWLQGPMDDRGWGDWSMLRGNYLAADFLADAHNQGLQKSVHVQANFDPANPVMETQWLDNVAQQPDSGGYPHAIVAYANLAAPDVEAVLEAHSRYSRVRGIRQVLNRHSNPKLNRANRDFLAEDAWQANLGLLRKYGMSFDAQVYYQQMEPLARVARRYSDLQFILDHAGMPAERDATGLEGWRRGMRLLADCPNVTVKLSGYGMMDLHWSVDSIRPFVLEPIEIFGARRCMFGSNFPVDKLMADYDRLWNAYRALIADFSSDEQHMLLYATAERVYRLA